jgi:predicted nucleic acid-binding protein
VAGRASISTNLHVGSLVDTNILVYCHDPSNLAKRERARQVLRTGWAENSLYIPHQAIVEFLQVTVRGRAGHPPLLSREQACRQADDFLDQFPILYPSEAVLGIAMLGFAAYRFSWFDAHLWAHAEHYGMSEILSEDFEHGRRYGTVRVRNPFFETGLG